MLTEYLWSWTSLSLEEPISCLGGVVLQESLIVLIHISIDPNLIRQISPSSLAFSTLHHMSLLLKVHYICWQRIVHIHFTVLRGHCPISMLTVDRPYKIMGFVSNST